MRPLPVKIEKIFCFDKNFCEIFVKIQKFVVETKVI